eukprot:PhF_6_TR42169/c0_g1_i1/m.63758/K00164/OGDH, sucA; 2-oxoglutarate dehydrogenase E1 component
MMRRMGIRFQSVPRRYPLHKHDSFANMNNCAYLDEILESEGNEAWKNIVSGSAAPRDAPILKTEIRPASTSSGQTTFGSSALGDAARLAWMCRAWEVRGHAIASVDPLNLHNGLLRLPELSGLKPEELEPQFFGFTDADIEREFSLGISDEIGGLLGQHHTMTLRAIHEKLKSIYAGPVGYEFMHIVDSQKTKWLRDRIETSHLFPSYKAPTNEQKINILEDLARGELFEKFLHDKFVGIKRFGLDGGESLIPGMMEMLTAASDHGIEHVVLGMPHRGRLSVLTNVCGKPMEALFKEFKGLSLDELQGEGSGDVKYHLGMSSKRQLRNGKCVNLSLMANPSHLEAVDPLVEGKTRAKQFYLQDDKHEKVMAVQIHGDAAFAGQGVCFETMGMCGLQSYKTGGTIHIVVNNQIGFTTDPKKSRSSPYCTDLGRVFGCPIFHVNGDCPEEVARVFKLATEWRTKFKSSVIIDLICYRRYGHNETDEPMFTQPLMYKAIKEHPSILTKYSRELIAQGVLKSEEFDALKTRINDSLRSSLQNASNYTFKKSEWFESYWTGFKKQAHVFGEHNPTQLSADRYAELAKSVCLVPERIKMHPTLKRVLDHRNQCLLKGTDLDWGAAEALAFGSLLKEGIHIRLSGQDVERGTFSHRHAVVHDQVTDEMYCALKVLSNGQFVASNSHLSEYGVLGYELGYSMENPKSLVIWEGQFGDFANGAQIIFDQFLSSGEAKWGRQCGIVVNLPHGYDGAGPEHSSGRIERFLQMVDEPECIIPYSEASHVRINMEVVYPSTPANYFHVLRRQVHRNFRKPLIVFFSKAFLRAPNVSSMQDIIGNTFQPVIKASNTDPQSVKRLIFCSGQISHYLLKAAADGARTDIAISRVEQLAPFPSTLIQEEIEKYSGAEVVWVQEEPRNMGAWNFVSPRLEAILEPLGKAPKYIGRPQCASVATGHKKQHDRQHKELMEAAITNFK